jgi:hypothetical protein
VPYCQLQLVEILIVEPALQLVELGVNVPVVLPKSKFKSSILVDKLKVGAAQD